jgi:hypothetical protein
MQRTVSAAEAAFALLKMRGVGHLMVVQLTILAVAQTIYPFNRVSIANVTTFLHTMMRTLCILPASQARGYSNSYQADTA